MDCNIIIIGGGVVGLSIAHYVSQKFSGKEIYVLERHEKYGQETSSRNSEVIHAGIYYKPGSLKAKLCHQGRDMIYNLASNGVESNKIGKLIVATTDDQVEELHQIQKNAKLNDVDLEFLTEKQVKDMEPHITTKGALFSAQSGIVNSHKLMEYFLHSAEEKGVAAAFGCEVIGLEKIAGGYKVSVMDRNEGEYDITSEVIINSAGLDADTIANYLGLDYKLHYCKGNYFGVTNGKHKFINHLIYPTPEKNNVGLGTHITLDLQGAIRLGPDAHYIQREQDYDVDESNKEAFYKSVNPFAPFIELEDLFTDMAGIRPKLQAPGSPAKDFIIQEDLPGLINLLGIESPGLTSAPAIGKLVADML